MRLLGDFKAVINNKAFIRMWSAQAISNFGDAIVKIALMLYITQKTQSVVALSSIIAVQTLPFILIGPFAGVVVDRFNKKLVMIICDLARALLVILIPYCTALWMTYVISFLVGVCGCFFTPARMSLIPDVVGEKQYMSAHSLSNSTYYAMALVGPALGGMLIAWLGIKLVFIIDSMTFIVSAFIFMLTSLPKSELAKKRCSYFTDFKEGLHYIKSNSQLKFLLYTLGVMLLFVGGFGALLTDYVYNVLQASPTEYGFVQSSLACGLLITSLIIGYFSNKLKRGSVILNSMLITGLVSCFFFTKPKMFVLYLWAFTIGCSDGALDIPLSSLLVELSPKEMRARILSVYSSIIRVCSMIGLALVGPMAELIGTAYAIGLIGAIMAFIGLVARFAPSFKQINYSAVAND